MKTKFKTSFYGDQIKEVKCERETEKSVWIIHEWSSISGGRKTEARRHNKQSEYECYFDTWEEAKQYLISRVEKRIISYTSRLNRERALLRELENLTQPKTA